MTEGRINPMSYYLHKVVFYCRCVNFISFVYNLNCSESLVPQAKLASLECVKYHHLYLQYLEYGA